jgi:hypothetical protein
VHLKFGVHFAAGVGDKRGGTFPATDSLLAFSLLFEQFDSGPENIYFMPNTESLLQTLDSALVLFPDHQRPSHIFSEYIEEYIKKNILLKALMECALPSSIEMLMEQR